MARSLTIEQMREDAKARNGYCLSDEYINAQTKLEWQCGSGHVFMMTPNSVRSGKWCPNCAGNAKHTIEFFKELAESRGGKCLSRKYKGAHVKLKWRCKYGHTWEATPASVKHSTWCPTCGHKKTGRKPGSIQKMWKLAQQRGGKCLSKEYVNSTSKLLWECELGHRWDAKPKDIQRGRWCAVCAGKRWTIEDMRKIAQKRNGECLSDKYVNSKTKLRWRCRKGHEWEATPPNVRTGSWCPICGKESAARKRRHSMEFICNIAEERGGECLSKEFVNSKTKLHWKCKNGHEWYMLLHSVIYGQWCPQCHQNKRKYSIFDMRAVAKQRKGQCLSKKYLGMKTELKWQCKEGHTWEAKPREIITYGHWCPVCRGDQPPTNYKKYYLNRPIPKFKIEDMEEIAKRWGGHCLSREYVDEDFELAWMCAKGHTWMSAPRDVRKGRWCKVCKKK